MNNTLLKSSTRFDHIIHKNDVSNARKKYHKLELVPISTGTRNAANIINDNSNKNAPMVAEATNQAMEAMAN